MRPLPSRCPFCGLESKCVDWQEVDVGVGVMQFEHEYECPAHGCFVWIDDAVGKRVAVWRDGEPLDRIIRGEMSASGCCMNGIGTADGGMVWCARKYKHRGAHENGGLRWSGKNPFELLDRAFDEVLAWL